MEVSYAVLHNGIFVPDEVGKGVNLKPTLVANSAEGKSLNLKMSLKDGYLLINVRGNEVLLPLTSVSHFVLAKK